jgi:hypothetical protein
VCNILAPPLFAALNDLAQIRKRPYLIRPQLHDGMLAATVRRETEFPDQGRPYNFTTAIQLLDDFWKEVRRMLDEKGIPNDL